MAGDGPARMLGTVGRAGAARVEGRRSPAIRTRLYAGPMAQRTTSWHLDGLDISDHVLDVPWDHDQPEGRTIEVFARVVATADGGGRPYLLFLQGGPGQESPRPSVTPSNPSWLDRALRDYRVVLLDQRGTGRSTPYGGSAVDPAADAEYLTRFRADAIVRDSEMLRQHLGAERWSLLGQSFGGFCSLHYLSTAAESLREVLVTGGLPPVGRPPEEVYAATYARMRALTERHYARFPGDRDRLRAAIGLAERGELRLLDGTAVSPRRLQGLGQQLGMDGGSVALHYLLERDPTSPAFAADLHGLAAFSGRNPLYAVIHESSYADGHPTRWAAERTMPDDVRADPTLLTGEHVFDWQFAEFPDLAPYREVAAILAEHRWPRLYDADVLSTVDVPVAAAVYADDPYVDRSFSEETAALLPNARTWVNDHLHNALRVSGDEVLGRLIEMVRR